MKYILFVFFLLASSACARAPRVYVTNERTGAITVIDANANSVITTFHVNGRARGIVVSSDGRTLYVAVSIPMGQRHASSDDQEKIIAMDAMTGKILHRYDVGADPERLALNADERCVLVANEDAGLASIYDLKRDAWIKSVVVGLQPEGVRMDRNCAYVTSEGSNCVSVIDARKIAVQKLVFVDGNPRDVLIHGGRAYIACEGSGSVDVLDTRTHTVLDRIKLPAGSRPMSLALAGNKLFVSNGRANTVSAIDIRTNKVIATLATGARTWGIAVTPDKRRVYAANSLDKSLSVIDVNTMKVVSTIPVEPGSWGVAVSN